MFIKSEADIVEQRKVLFIASLFSIQLALNMYRIVEVAA